MAFTQKAAFCRLARLAVFITATVGIFCVFAALPQTARAQTVFEGEKRARYNETNYRYKGEITGRVLLDDGKPAVGFVVKAEFSHGHSLSPGEGSAKTDAQGNYRIHGLVSFREPFRVKVDNYRTGYVAEPARLIHVYLFPNGKAGNVNFTVRRGPKITVRVRDAETGEPVADVAVASQEDRIVISRGEVGKTDAKGELTFRADDLEVDLFLDEATLRAQKSSFAPGYSNFKRVRLPKIADTVVDIKTYKDRGDYPWVTFRGMVVDAKNKPVPSVTVRLSRSGDNLETVSDAKGRFSFRTSRANQLRAGVITVEKGNSSTTFYPTAEQTWGLMTVRLDPAVKPSEIKGQVVSESGEPFAGASVSISSRVPDPRSGAGSFLNLPREYRGLTDATGHFSIKGLPEEGSYRVEFTGDALLERDRPDGKPIAWKEPYPDNWISLKKGETHDIGRVTMYSPDSILIGHVSSPPEIPFRQLRIVAESKSFRSPVPLDEGGNFRIPNATREPVQLSVYQSSDNGRGSDAQGSSLKMLYRGVIKAEQTRVTLDLRNVGLEKAVLIGTP